jgi:putative membrane protein
LGATGNEVRVAALRGNPIEGGSRDPVAQNLRLAGPRVIWASGPYCGPAPVPEELLLRWNLDPIVLTMLFALALASRRSGYGLAATAILTLVFVSPLCALSSALFSARVLHHVLMVAVAAPLLALARPARAVTPVGLPFLLATMALWIWHLPAAYDTALSSVPLYWLVFWRAVFSQTTGAGLGWVFLAYLQMGMLGAILTLAPMALYATHFTVPMLWGYTPLADQQLGGLIMWMPAALAYAVWGALLAHRAWREMGVPG